MSKDKKHMDELEEFYRSAFDSAEMDVPSALTDSLIDKLQEKNVSTVNKKRLSERIGASKLYKYLQMSLLFNLITLTTLGVYLLNDNQGDIKMETPVNYMIIEDNQQQVEQKIDEKSMLDDVALPSHKELEKGIPHTTIVKPTNEDVELQKTEEVDKQPVIDSVISSEIDVPVGDELMAIDSTKQKVIERPKIKGSPADLDALRDRFKDTVKGKPLFK